LKSILLGFVLPPAKFNHPMGRIQFTKEMDEETMHQAEDANQLLTQPFSVSKGWQNLMVKRAEVAESILREVKDEQTPKIGPRFKRHRLRHAKMHDVHGMKFQMCSTDEQKCPVRHVDSLSHIFNVLGMIAERVCCDQTH
jgi:hypothetical protein